MADMFSDEWMKSYMEQWNAEPDLSDALAQIKDFDGITGRMTFTDQGDPIKCAVVVKVSDEGTFVFEESVCP